jgi:transposase
MRLSGLCRRLDSAFRSQIGCATLPEFKKPTKKPGVILSFPNSGAIESIYLQLILKYKHIVEKLASDFFRIHGLYYPYWSVLVSFLIVDFGCKYDDIGFLHFCSKILVGFWLTINSFYTIFNTLSFSFVYGAYRDVIHIFSV